MKLKQSIRNGIESLLTKEVSGKVESAEKTRTETLGYYVNLYTIKDSRGNSHLVGFHDCKETEYPISKGDVVAVRVSRFPGQIASNDSGDSWKEIKFYHTY